MKNVIQFPRPKLPQAPKPPLIIELPRFYIDVYCNGKFVNRSPEAWIKDECIFLLDKSLGYTGSNILWDETHSSCKISFEYIEILTGKHIEYSYIYKLIPEWAVKGNDK